VLSHNCRIEDHTDPDRLARDLERFADLAQPLAIHFAPERGLLGSFVIELLTGEVLTVPAGYESAGAYVLNDAIHCPMCGTLAVCDPGFSPMLVNVQMKVRQGTGRQQQIRAVCDDCARSWSLGCDEFGDALSELRVRVQRVWLRELGLLIGELRDLDRLTPITGIISV
jgi:hypothetical protein